MTEYKTMLQMGNSKAALTAANPTPAARQLVTETDTGQVKVGNGSTPYNSLPYVGEASIRDLFTIPAGDSEGRSSLDLGMMSSPPTVSTGTASLDAALTNSYMVTTTPTAFRTSGGTPTIFSTNFWTFPVVNVVSGSGNLGGTANAVGYAVEFMADADRVQIQVLRGTSTLGIMVEVDGQRMTSVPLSWTATGSTMYILADFGVRAIRKFRVEGDQYGGFRGVNVRPTCTVWKPPGPPEITVAVVGDSVAAQTGATRPNGGFVSSIGKLLGWNDIRAVALSGSGYVLAGASGCVFGHSSRVADTVACNPQVVIIPGSTNDLGQSGVSAAALAAWQAYRTALPNTPIVIGGIFPGAGGPSAALLALETLLKTTFDTWADPNSYWVPISTDPAGPWISGTGKVGSTNASGNSDIYVSSDGVHPSQAGHDFYARRWAAALRQIVLPNL